MLLADQILSFQNLFPELNYLFSLIFDIANISFLQAKPAERAIDRGETVYFQGVKVWQTHTNTQSVQKCIFDLIEAEIC